ncbi:MAG: LysR family transcriptional regulator [Opitutae bacterium]|nr:LysR family transcriptional regulator [Opitutae bacterium]MCD8298938.1 LysR family transcriptional regulator [Opitutae bacterium]
MTLQQLKYVVAIVRSGSISEAAKRLYLSQPSLSNAVRDLEHELGIEIFHRSVRGIALSADGREFLGYARQILEQANLLEQRYSGNVSVKKICSVSTQHYAFAVEAFVNSIANLAPEKYEFTLRETRTHEIIEDVKNFRSELGILYLSEFNGKVIRKLLRESGLVFNSLLTAKPHVFVSSSHPLAKAKSVSLKNLEPFPCLSFEQGEHNSFYFSEEILSTVAHKKRIMVSDRATLFNMLIGLNGYTICTGILNENLNGTSIVSVPLRTKEHMNVGWISREKAILSDFAKSYVAELKRLIAAKY